MIVMMDFQNQRWQVPSLRSGGNPDFLHPMATPWCHQTMDHGLEISKFINLLRAPAPHVSIMNSIYPLVNYNIPTWKMDENGKL